MQQIVMYFPLQLVTRSELSTLSEPPRKEFRPPLQKLQVPSINTAISQQKTTAFSYMFSSCQIENVNRPWMCDLGNGISVFFFFGRKPFFQRYCKFCSVNYFLCCWENFVLVWLFDWLMPFGLNSQMRAGLQKRFDWPFHLTWQISGELKVSSN